MSDQLLFVTQRWLFIKIIYKIKIFPPSKQIAVFISTNQIFSHLQEKQLPPGT